MTRRQAVLFAIMLLPATAAAQVDQVTTPPLNLVLSNYNSVPVGPYRRPRRFRLRGAYRRSVGGVVQPRRPCASGDRADQRQRRYLPAHLRGADGIARSRRIGAATAELRRPDLFTAHRLHGRGGAAGDQHLASGNRLRALLDGARRPAAVLVTPPTPSSTSGSRRSARATRVRAAAGARAAAWRSP